jgi:hypothetical protein
MPYKVVKGDNDTIRVDIDGTNVYCSRTFGYVIAENEKNG